MNIWASGSGSGFFFLIDRFQVLDPHYIQNPQFGTTLHNPDPHSRILTNRVNQKQLLRTYWYFFVIQVR